MCLLAIPPSGLHVQILSSGAFLDSQIYVICMDILIVLLSFLMGRTWFFGFMGYCHLAAKSCRDDRYISAVIALVVTLLCLLLYVPLFIVPEGSYRPEWLDWLG